MSVSRVLIVGLGSIGSRHLFVVRSLLPHADIRVLRRLKSASVSTGSNGEFYNIHDALAFKPQIAVIANPAPYHISIATMLAASGVHLLIEKPLSNSLLGIDNLVQQCIKSNLVAMVGYNLRFLPSLLFFKDYLSTFDIGNVLSIRSDIGQYLPTWRPGSDFLNGVSARSDLGGGALLELSHELDYLRWIFGEVVWVKATLSRQSELVFDVEDSVHLTLGFSPLPNGRQLIGVVNLDLIRHDTTRQCTAIGEYGSLNWNAVSGEVSIFKTGFKKWEVLYKHSYSRDYSYFEEWRHFLDCILLNKRPLISIEDGFNVLQIIEAARKSDKFFHPVFINTMK